MATVSIDPTSFIRPQTETRSAARNDYRLMVEAIQSGDLHGAQKAYDGLAARLGTGGKSSDDALTRIGGSLRAGDLATAGATLNRLEDRAQQVLGRLRKKLDDTPQPANSGAVPKGSTYRITI